MSWRRIFDIPIDLEGALRWERCVRGGIEDRPPTRWKLRRAALVAELIEFDQLLIAIVLEADLQAHLERTPVFLRADTEKTWRRLPGFEFAARSRLFRVRRGYIAGDGRTIPLKLVPPVSLGEGDR